MAEEDGKKPKRALGKILLIGINVFIFLAGAAFFLLTKFGVLDKPQASELLARAMQGTDTASEESAADKGTKDEPQQDLTIISLRPFVVNLSGDRGRRYLRLVLQLGAEGDEAKKDIEKHMAQIRNRLIFLLSAKTYEEINTIQGKYQLQAEINTNLNETLGTQLIKKTYFTEFIVQ